MKKAAVVSRGWLGDTIACTAAAHALVNQGYQVDFYHLWPQLQPVLNNQRAYKSILYGRHWIRLLPPPWSKVQYDRIVTEPTPWSYTQPFTSEIQKLAGIEVPSPRLEKINLSIPLHSILNKPLLIVSRDIYKRSYGRNIDDLISKLKKRCLIGWIGLHSNQDSKRGVRQSLLDTAVKLTTSDLYLGPEGGMLWLAGLVGCNSVYLTEHIEETEKRWPQMTDDCFDFQRISSGSVAKAAPAGCSNETLCALIEETMEDLGVRI